MFHVYFFLIYTSVRENPIGISPLQQIFFSPFFFYFYLVFSTRSSRGRPASHPSSTSVCSARVFDGSCLLLLLPVFLFLFIFGVLLVSWAHRWTRGTGLDASMAAHMLVGPWLPSSPLSSFFLSFLLAFLACLFLLFFMARPPPCFRLIFIGSFSSFAQHDDISSLPFSFSRLVIDYHIKKCKISLGLRFFLSCPINLISIVFVTCSCSFPSDVFDLGRSILCNSLGNVVFRFSWQYRNGFSLLPLKYLSVLISNEVRPFLWGPLVLTFGLHHVPFILSTCYSFLSDSDRKGMEIIIFFIEFYPFSLEFMIVASFHRSAPVLFLCFVLFFRFVFCVFIPIRFSFSLSTLERFRFFFLRHFHRVCSSANRCWYSVPRLLVVPIESTRFLSFLLVWRSQRITRSLFDFYWVFVGFTGFEWVSLEARVYFLSRNFFFRSSSLSHSHFLSSFCFLRIVFLLLRCFFSSSFRLVFRCRPPPQRAAIMFFFTIFLSFIIIFFTLSCVGWWRRFQSVFPRPDGAVSRDAGTWREMRTRVRPPRPNDP